MSQPFSNDAFGLAEADSAPALALSPVPPPGVDEHTFFAAALVATIREPFAVFSPELRIIAANRSFRAIFQARFTNENGFLFGDVDDAQWDRATLQVLQDALSQSRSVTDLPLDFDVPELGRRRMRLNAHHARNHAGDDTLLFVALEDVTASRKFEDLRVAMQKEQELFLVEVHHRVANSLQIIASLLLLKARAVQSTETRQHLRDVHHRLISLATVQRQLSVARPGSEVELGPYLKVLCEGLASSMISDDQGVTIQTSTASGAIRAEEAVSFGLIVTELVINSLKHGFPDGRSGHIEVEFRRNGAGWRLSVSDDGVGRSPGSAIRVRPGLGTNIVEALARSLGATVEIGPDGPGAKTAIIHTS